jgi:hypothetical protein
MEREWCVEQLRQYNEENAEYRRLCDEVRDMSPRLEHRCEAETRSDLQWDIKYGHSRGSTRPGDVEYSLYVSRETEPVRHEAGSIRQRQEHRRFDREGEKRRLDDYIHEFELRHARERTQPTSEELDLQDALCDAERRRWRTVELLEDRIAAQQQEMGALRESLRGVKEQGRVVEQSRLV